MSITYLLTNMITGEEYVGHTNDRKGLPGRLRNHKYRSKLDQYQHLPLYKNIKEYGWENFRSSVLCEGNEEEYYCWLLNPPLNQCFVGKKPVSQLQVQRSRESRNKPVRCIETGVVYENSRVIDLPGVSYKGVSGVCRGKRETHGGYHWEFVE